MFYNLFGVMNMNYDLLKKNFESHGFSTQYFKTKEEAAEYLCQNLKGKTIGFGGSKNSL